MKATYYSACVAFVDYPADGDTPEPGVSLSSMETVELSDWTDSPFDRTVAMAGHAVEEIGAQWGVNEYERVPELDGLICGDGLGFIAKDGKSADCYMVVAVLPD